MGWRKGLLAALVLAPLASACGPLYSTTYRYVPPRDAFGRSCAQDCLAAKERCEERIERRHRMCVREAEDDAERAFRRYRKERIESGKPLKRSLSDFERREAAACGSGFALGGEKESGCLPNYQMCFQNCGGAVVQQRECVAFCG